MTCSTVNTGTPVTAFISMLARPFGKPNSHKIYSVSMFKLKKRPLANKERIKLKKYYCTKISNLIWLWPYFISKSLFHLVFIQEC